MNRGSSSPPTSAAPLSKALVRPENVGSRLVDYRISTYQPMAYVEMHKARCARADLSRAGRRGDDDHRRKKTIVRRHDVIFIPPAYPFHRQQRPERTLTFIVVTTPVEDGEVWRGPARLMPRFRSSDESDPRPGSGYDAARQGLGRRASPATRIATCSAREAAFLRQGRAMFRPIHPSRRCSTCTASSAWSAR